MKRTRHEVLSKEEERELGMRMEAGKLAEAFLAANETIPPDAYRDFQRQVRDGRRAADEFALQNIRLVINLASRYRHRTTTAMDFDDLIQEGYLGLAHAISKWDYRRELKFSTYATWWIRQHLERAIDNRSRTIRLPVHLIGKIRLLSQAELQLTRRHIAPSSKRLAQELGWKASDVEMLMLWKRSATSLDALLGNRSASIGEFVADDLAVPEDQVVSMQLSRDLRVFIKDVLPERECMIIALRFGLNGEEPLTLEEVGQLFGLTRERIRQLEGKALTRLLQHAGQRELHHMLDLDDDAYQSKLASLELKATERANERKKKAVK